MLIELSILYSLFHNLAIFLLLFEYRCSRRVFIAATMGQPGIPGLAFCMEKDHRRAVLCQERAAKRIVWHRIV